MNSVQQWLEIHCRERKINRIRLVLRAWIIVCSVVALVFTCQAHLMNRETFRILEQSRQQKESRMNELAEAWRELAEEWTTEEKEALREWYKGTRITEP